MKKGKYILLGICLVFLSLTIGVFIGRNFGHTYKMDEPAVMISEPDRQVTADVFPNINKMNKVQLMALPGIGETLAERIIAYRDENGFFTEIEELLNVEGIGEKKLEQIMGLVGVGG